MVNKEEMRLLQEAQVYQQQMQVITAQKEALNLQLNEIKKAKEELGKLKEGEVYKISGPILIKSKKTDVEKDLSEKEELINMKIKTMERSEQKIREKINGLIKSKQPEKEDAVAE